MKRLKFFTLITCLLAAISVNVRAQRTISSIAVVFNTTSDDKDNDTYLECQMLTPDNHWFAQNAGQFGLFPNNSTYTLNLNMGDPYYSEALLSQSALYVHIIPNGHDTWVFGWTVIVTLSDGSQRKSWGTGALTQDNSAFRLVVF